MGDRLANLARAVALIGERTGSAVTVSRPVETQPWGYSSPNAYLNAAAALDADITPRQMLTIIHAIEACMESGSHRDKAGGYADRVIDIDILTAGDMVTDAPDLTLPHPLMAQRRFVLEPLAQIAPQWTHPTLRLTAAQLLARLP